jgi:hypothetical protein
VRFRPDGSRQVTDFELLARTHVNEECEPHYWRLCALSVCVCSSRALLADCVVSYC